MPYERRARNFSFMGVTPVGRTVEVVTEEDDRPEIVMPYRPSPTAESTVDLGANEFRLKGVRVRLD